MPEDGIGKQELKLPICGGKDPLGPQPSSAVLTAPMEITSGEVWSSHSYHLGDEGAQCDAGMNPNKRFRLSEQLQRMWARNQSEKQHSLGSGSCCNR